MPKNAFDGHYLRFVNDRVRPVLEKHGRIFVIVTEIEDGMYTAMVPLFATRNRRCIVYFKEDGEFVSLSPIHGRADERPGSLRITSQEITASFPVDVAGSPWADEVMEDLRKLMHPNGVLRLHTFEDRAGKVQHYAGGL